MSAVGGAPRPVHWATLGEAGLSAGLWLLWFVHRLFGRWAFRALMAPATLWFVAARPVARRASIDYLRRVGVLPAGAGRLRAWMGAVRHFSSFAETVLDKALVWGGGLDVSRAPVEVDPRFDAAVRAGRGGVLLVAHVGNLEALRAFGRRLPGLRLNVLVHSANAVRFARALERLDARSTAGLLQVTEMDAAMAASLAERVARGEWVVIAADRVPISERARTLSVDFLGAPAPLPVGPWVLARALGGPVYQLSCLKHGRTYRLRCEHFAERIDWSRAGRDQALHALASRYARGLEAQCREAPLQWFNFYPFWESDRDGH